MTTKTKWILALLIVGLIGFAAIEGWVKPHFEQEELVYQQEQQSPLTHDFSRVLPYQHPYMGNAGNLSNLNIRLPLFDQLTFTFQLYPEEFHAMLIFEKDLDNLDSILRDQAFMYNATANFALIDNLQRLTLQFPDQEYSFSRDQVIAWYGGIELSSLQEEERWDQAVRAQLNDEEKVLQFIEQTAIIVTKIANEAGSPSQAGL